MTPFTPLARLLPSSLTSSSSAAASSSSSSNPLTSPPSPHEAKAYTHPALHLAPFAPYAWTHAVINDDSLTPLATSSREPKPRDQGGEDSLIAETLAGERGIRGCLTFVREEKKEEGGEREPKETKGEETAQARDSDIESESESESAYPEALTLLALGDGLNGHARTLHGGMIATIMDEVLAVALMVVQARRYAVTASVLGGSSSASPSAEASAASAQTQPGPSHRSSASTSSPQPQPQPQTQQSPPPILTASLHLTYLKPVRTPGAILARARLVHVQGRKYTVRGSLEDGQGVVLARAEGVFVALRARL
ncbi:MAG: hypothetical protein M1819_000041 [Sarea resinae]|nr:MAG: hypothetical protein M1819_000041 [Sarea resinae]